MNEPNTFLWLETTKRSDDDGNISQWLPCAVLRLENQLCALEQYTDITCQIHGFTAPDVSLFPRASLSLKP